MQIKRKQRITDSNHTYDGIWKASDHQHKFLGQFGQFEFQYGRERHWWWQASLEVL